GPGPRELPDHGLDVTDRTTTRERGIEIFQAFAVEMGVGIDEAGHDRGAPQIHDLRPAIAQSADLAIGADGDDAVARDRECRRVRARRIERGDAAVDEDVIGRYVVHSFSIRPLRTGAKLCTGQAAAERLRLA